MSDKWTLRTLGEVLSVDPFHHESDTAKPAGYCTVCGTPREWRRVAFDEASGAALHDAACHNTTCPNQGGR